MLGNFGIHESIVCIEVSVIWCMVGLVSNERIQVMSQSNNGGTRVSIIYVQVSMISTILMNWSMLYYFYLIFVTKTT